MTGKLCLFIATSLDGFIAKKDGDIKFLDKVDETNQDYGYLDFIKDVDSVILGRKTFDKVTSMVGDEFSYDKRPVYVISHQTRPNIRTISFRQDPISLVKELKDQGQKIFCDGGSDLIHTLLKAKLVDEITISFIPILLGDGIRLFQSGLDKSDLQLVDSKAYKSGLVQVHYTLKQ
jgi:dihydrofolate reductase